MIPLKVRSQLINDVFSLSQANKVDTNKPFELIKYLSNENEYLPWYSFLSRVDFYMDMIGSSEIYGDFRDYILDLVRPIYFKLTWYDDKTDDWLTRKLRSLILRFACSLDLPDCVQKSKTLFSEFMRDESTNK